MTIAREPYTIATDEDVSKFERSMIAKGLLNGLLNDWHIVDGVFKINEYENEPSNIKTCRYNISNFDTFNVVNL